MRPACDTLYDRGAGLGKHRGAGRAVRGTDVYFEEIFITIEILAAFEAQASNKHKALSQLMSKRQESEYCERYRPLQSKYFTYMIDAHEDFCDEWSGKVSRGGPHWVPDLGEAGQKPFLARVSREGR